MYLLPDPLEPQFYLIYLISKSANNLQTVRSQRSENNTYRSILSTGRYSTDQPQHILSCRQYTSFSLTDFYSLPEVEIAVGCSSETNKGRMLLYSLLYHSRGQKTICISLILLFQCLIELLLASQLSTSTTWHECWVSECIYLFFLIFIQVDQIHLFFKLHSQEWGTTQLFPIYPRLIIIGWLSTNPHFYSKWYILESRFD